MTHVESQVNWVFARTTARAAARRSRKSQSQKVKKSKEHLPSPPPAPPQQKSNENVKRAFVRAASAARVRRPRCHARRRLRRSPRRHPRYQSKLKVVTTRLNPEALHDEQYKSRLFHLRGPTNSLPQPLDKSK